MENYVASRKCVDDVTSSNVRFLCMRFELNCRYLHKFESLQQLDGKYASRYQAISDRETNTLYKTFQVPWKITT